MAAADRWTSESRRAFRPTLVNMTAPIAVMAGVEDVVELASVAAHERVEIQGGHSPFSNPDGLTPGFEGVPASDALAPLPPPTELNPILNSPKMTPTCRCSGSDLRPLLQAIHLKSSSWIRRTMRPPPRNSSNLKPDRGGKNG